MTGLDIIVLVLAGAAGIMGFARGFVQEALSLLAWIGAVLAIWFLHVNVSALLLDYVGGATSAAVLAFAFLLLLPLLIISVLARKIGAASRNSLLGPVDRVLGFGFGLVKGTIIVVIGFSMLVLVYDSIWGPAGRPLWMVEARTYPFMKASSEDMVKLIGERRRALLDDEDIAGQ